MSTNYDFLDFSSPSVSPDNYGLREAIDRIERKAGRKLVPEVRAWVEQALMAGEEDIQLGEEAFLPAAKSTRSKSSPFDFSSYEPTSEDEAAWEATQKPRASAPALPSTKPVSTARGYISGSGTVSDPYIGTAGTNELLMETKRPDEWMRSPEGTLVREDTTLFQDAMATVGRIGASLGYIIENFGPEIAFRKAKTDLDDAHARGGRQVQLGIPSFARERGVGPEGPGVWKPISREEARKNFIDVERERADIAARREARAGALPTSIAYQQQNVDIAEADKSPTPVRSTLEALLTKPGATATKAAEMLGIYAPATAAATAVPEAAVPIFAVMSGADVRANAIDTYLSKHGINPADAEARVKFWEENPEKIDEAINSADLHTAAAAGSAVAGAAASRFMEPIVRRGTPVVSATKRLASDAIVQPPVFIAADRAASAIAGEEHSAAQDVQAALLPLPQIVHGAVSQYRGRVRSDATRSRDYLDSLLTRYDERVAEASRSVKEKEQPPKDAPEPVIRPEEYSAEQKAAEEEAGFRTIERERIADKLSENPAFRVKEPEPVSPEEVQAEWQSRKEAEDARLERVDMGLLDEQLRRRREVAAKKEAAKQEQESAARAKAEAARKRLETVHRNKILDQVLLDNPDKSPEELISVAREAIKANPFVEPAASQEAARAPAGEPATKPRVARRKPAAQAPVKPKAKTELDAELDAIASKLDLDMAEEAGAATPREEFKTKAKAVVDNLVKYNSAKNDAILETIKQGKLVVAPNGKSIGRPQDEGAASYSVDDGKMYLYTDSLDTRNALPTAIRAAHEGTHAGQFNDRDGRPSVLKQMMGDKYNAVHDLIVRNYGKNKLATAAVDKALAAAKKKTSKMSGATRLPIAERVANLELVPYFVGEASASRSGFGRLGGAVHDIKHAARQFVRNKLGINLDVSLSDIIAASEKVPEEVAATTLKPKKEALSLDMVLGKEAKEFRDALARKATYYGAKDNKERFLVSDEKAELTTDESVIKDLIDGKSVPLGEVLSHERLYNNYSDLPTDYNVAVDRSLSGGEAYYSHDGDKPLGIPPKSVVIGLTAAKNLQHPIVRNTILHEVQHAVQRKEGFVAGANEQNFIPSGVKRRLESATFAVKSAVARFDLGRALATMDSRTRDYIDGVRSARQMSAVETADYVLSQGLFKASTDRMVKRYGDGPYKAALEEQLEAQSAYNTALDRARDTYRRDYGEAEARTTELTSRLTQPELESRPFESRFVEAAGNVPVERTLDTTPFARERRAAPRKTEESLDMAVPKEEASETKKPLIQRLPSWMAGLIDSASGAGTVAREIMEAASASPAAERMRAEGNIGKYRDALAEEASKRGVSAEDLNKQIMDRLDKIDSKTDSYSENFAAYKAAVAPFGKAGEALLEFRKQADDLSIQMLRARAEQGDPLTKEEKATYQTIRNNLGRYSHRQYAVHLGKSGEKYAEGVMADYAKYRESEGKNASPHVKANYEKVARVVRKLIDEQLTIPDDETILSMKTEQVDRMFDVWGGVVNPKAFTTDQKRAKLSEIRDAVNGDKEQMRRTAESIVEEILDIAEPTSLAAKYYRGGKLDKGILKERTNIAPEIRELMGEIKDPAMRMFVTVAKQVEFVARNRMLNELRGMNDKFNLQPPGAAGRKEVEGMVKLEDPAYGPLQNHYVSKNLHNLLADHVQQLANFEQAVAMAASRNDVLGTLAANKALKAWGRIAGTAKMLQIIYKPTNFLLNFMGGPRTMLVHGNVNPKYLGEALQTARDIVHYSINPTSNSPLARRAAAAGITDSAFNGEIKGELYEELNRTLNQMRGQSSSKIAQALRTAKDYAVKGKVATNEAYAMMDVTYKIANFLQMADMLKKYYKAEGIDKTAEQIDREAADITNRTNVTYKRAAPIVRALEKYGVSNFGTFFYEVFRSEINNLRQGFSELRRAQEAKTPEGAAIMRMQGARRLVGQLTAWGLTAAASRYLAELAFGEDSEKEQKIRNMLPDYERSKDFIVVGQHEDGSPVLLDVARIDPAGPITDIMRAALNTDADIDEIENNIYQLYVAPRIGTRIAEAVGTSTGLSDRKPGKPVMQQLFPETFEKLLTATNAAGIGDRSTKAWANVAETFAPGIISSWRDSNARPIVEDPASAAAWAMTYAGATMYKANPKAITTEAGFEYADVLKRNRKSISETFADNPNMNVDLLTGRLNDLKVEEEAAFDKVHIAYEGMQALGMSPREISVMLKTSGIPVAVIKDLKSGEFSFRSVSKKSIEQYRQRELAAAKSAEERKALKEKWKNIWAMLRTSEENLSNEED